MHGRVSFLLNDIFRRAFGETPPGPLQTGFHNIFGPLGDHDRYTAGGLIGSGSDDGLRNLMSKLAQRIGRASSDGGEASFWANARPLHGAVKKWENPDLPSGYTYLLQFIAHDIVDSALTAEGLSNARHAALSLEAVYGAGPDQSPQSYEYDRDHAGNPSRIPRMALRVSPRRRADETSMGATFACAFRDLARTRPLGADDSGNEPHLLTEGLLTDPRNDANFLVSQLTVLWHLLHNHLIPENVSEVGDTGDISLNTGSAIAYRRFLSARMAVTLIYRNIIEKDVLPNILHPLVHAHFKDFRQNPAVLLDTEPGLPLEFTHGAFRFAHAMVRDAYDVNGENQAIDTQRGIKGSELRDPDMIVVPKEWLVDWARFFPLGRDGDPKPNLSRRIGPAYPAALRNTALFPPNEERAEGGVHTRELLSASYAGMWSVPRLYDRLDRLGLADLARGLENGAPSQRTGNGYDAWRDPIRSWLRKGNESESRPLLAEVDIDRLGDDPPLPFFVLFEAAHELQSGKPLTPANGGRHLGPLGSIIVAEALYGALNRNRIAFEKAGSTLKQRLEACSLALSGKEETLAHIPEIETMPDLIRFMIAEDMFGDRAL